MQKGFYGSTAHFSNALTQVTTTLQQSPSLQQDMPSTQQLARDLFKPVMNSTKAVRAEHKLAF